MLTDDKIRFQRYDFGNDCNNRTRFQETCNQEVYGSMDPPEYDLSRITAPQVILQGNLDLMAVPEDILEQRRRLTHGVLVANLLYNGYSHMVSGDRAGCSAELADSKMHAVHANSPHECSI